MQTAQAEATEKPELSVEIEEEQNTVAEEVSTKEETAVCNLASIALPSCIDHSKSPSEYDFENAAYDKGLDFFLYKRVGYKTLNYLTPGLFVRPYAVTSVREYFASGIEAFYLGNKSELMKTSPVLYKKIDELHHLAS